MTMRWGGVEVVHTGGAVFICVHVCRCVYVPSCTCKISVFPVPEPCASESVDSQVQISAVQGSDMGQPEGSDTQVLVWGSPSLPLAHPTALLCLQPPPPSWTE